jgi:hypothetical protein
LPELPASTVNRPQYSGSGSPSTCHTNDFEPLTIRDVSAAAAAAAGPVCRLLLKLLHKRHVPPSVEVAVSLAGAYTVYLCTGELSGIMVNTTERNIT